MTRRDDDLICPYCGSLETDKRRERGDDAVYECDACDRTFSAPQ